MKAPGHVANQRRSLCGTKKITVTWPGESCGDTTRVALRIRMNPHSRAAVYAYIAPRGSTVQTRRSPTVFTPFVSASYVRAPAYRSAFKITLPRDASGASPWDAEIVEPFRHADHLSPPSPRQKMRTHAISFAFER